MDQYVRIDAHGCIEDRFWHRRRTWITAGAGGAIVIVYGGLAAMLSGMPAQDQPFLNQLFALPMPAQWGCGPRQQRPLRTTPCQDRNRRLASRMSLGRLRGEKVEAAEMPEDGKAALMDVLRKVQPNASDDGRLEDTVIMMGDYPFYISQPFEEMESVFRGNSARVRECLGGADIEVHQIGSSAIAGMPGCPVVDLLAVVPEYPPTAQQLSALAAAGFEAQGMAPHAREDMWFFGGDGAPGTLGRCVLHVVKAGNPFISDATAFTRYVQHFPEEFDRYAAVKTEGARLASVHGADGQKVTEYKTRKHAVCMRLMDNAKAWIQSEDPAASVIRPEDLTLSEDPAAEDPAAEDPAASA